MKEVENLNLYITTNKNGLYGLMDKSGKVIIDSSYIYLDYAFDKYFIAHKEGIGLRYY